MSVEEQENTGEERLQALETENLRLRDHIAALKEAYRQFNLHERALEHCTEGIAIFDVTQPENPLVYVNAGFELQTGYSREEVLFGSARFIHGPETDPDTLKAIRGAIRNREPYIGEILSYRKDGTPYWNRVSLTPLLDDSGVATHYVSVQSDVTSRVQSTVEVQMALEMLEQTNQHLTKVNRRMSKDLQAAAKMQQALLPDRLPRTAGVQFAWRFRPCDELAGDILNVFRLDKEHVGLYLLDVTGHGTAAALLAVSVSRFLSPQNHATTLVREHDHDEEGCADRVVPPAEVAQRLNRHFPWDSELGQFFTLVYGVLNTRTQEFRYVSAGHLDPLHLPAGGGVVVQKSGGLPIGIGDLPYEEKVIRLAPGDRLVLYSDGITETMNGERNLFGPKRLRSALEDGRNKGLEECLDHLFERLEDWNRGPRFDDDLSLVAMHVK